jgi:hypothetical protein
MQMPMRIFVGKYQQDKVSLSAKSTVIVIIFLSLFTNEKL